MPNVQVTNRRGKRRVYQVPVAAVTIQPKTQITSDMIKYVEVPSAYISDNAVTSDSEILKMYSNFNTVIPAGSMFYKETLTTEKALPNYLLKQLKKQDKQQHF